MWRHGQNATTFVARKGFVAVLLCCVPCSFAQTAGDVVQPSISETSDSALPNAPSATAPQSEYFVGALGIAAKTIGDYVARKEQRVGPIRAGKVGRVRDALLEHVDIGLQ